MDITGKLLIVDDEAIALNNLKHILQKEGHDIKSTRSGVSALKWLDEETFDLLLTDLRMEKVDGMRLLRKAKEVNPDTEVIMITGYATVDTAIEAMKAGAYHYIAKPYKIDEVRKVVREALEKHTLKQENTRLRKLLETFRGETKLITDNSRMKQLLETAAQVAVSDINVVLSGESGTGKELFAKFIHERSHRSEGPMLSVNCGVFNEDLLANELFGHEKGAFTGADETKKGLVEMADGGTLFLDEIAEMSPVMQVKLLRVLQEKEVLRVGGSRPIKVDVRFVTATNRDLREEVSQERFRQDLFFRINVVSIYIPPLSERKDDIPLLVQHFIDKYSALMDKKVRDAAPEVLEVLSGYDYPGNVRELENIIERGVALANGELVELAHLPEELRHGSIQTFRKRDGRFPTLEEMERSYIEWVLHETGNNKTEAAKALGMDRVSLWRKTKKFGIE